LILIFLFIVLNDNLMFLYIHIIYTYIILYIHIYIHYIYIYIIFIYIYIYIHIINDYKLYISLWFKKKSQLFVNRLEIAESVFNDSYISTRDRAIRRRRREMLKDFSLTSLSLFLSLIPLTACILCGLTVVVRQSPGHSLTMLRHVS